MPKLKQKTQAGCNWKIIQTDSCLVGYGKWMPDSKIYPTNTTAAVPLF